MEDKTKNSIQYSIEDISSVESTVLFCIENGEYQIVHDEMIPDIKRFINTHVSEMTQGQRDRYERALAQSQWAVIEQLHPEEVVDLFSKHFEFFFNYDAASVKGWVERVMVAFLTPIDRDGLKQQIRTIIKKCIVTIGSKQITVNNRRVLPSVQNWIHDYELFVGDKDASDTLFITQYLNTSPNIGGLDSIAHKQLEELLRFYVAMSFSSLTPQGNEDVILYHDVKSGHVMIIDHGKEIDTGAESDVVAKMTPEDREQARRDIKKRLDEIDQNLEKTGVPLTSLLVEQLSRNEELRRAINQSSQAENLTTNTAATLPVSSRRISVDQESFAPPAPQKVRPIEPATPMSPESIPVVASPKTIATKQQRPSMSPVKPMSLPKVPTPTPPAPAQSIPAPQPIPTPHPAPAPFVPPLPSAPPVSIAAPPQPMPKPKNVPQQAVQPRLVPRPTAAPLPEMPVQPTPKPTNAMIDYQSLAELVLAEHALLLASIEAENRFLSLIAAFAKGERTRDEVMTTLTMPIESGGVNLTADIAASCLNTAVRFTERTNMRMKRPVQEQSADTAPQPTFQQVAAMMQRHKEFDEAQKAQKQVTAPPQANFFENTVPAITPAQSSTSPQNTGVEDIFANLDVAQMQQKSVNPETDSPIRRIDSIRTQSSTQNTKRRFDQVMGPIEELKKFSTAELRAFGTNPEAATAFIKEKIDLQTQESISKRAEAIRAWQDSPLHQLYVQIGNASLTQGMPVGQYIAQRQQSGQETLTAAEFEAIASLNRQLRF